MEPHPTGIVHALGPVALRPILAAAGEVGVFGAMAVLGLGAAAAFAGLAPWLRRGAPAAA